MKPDHKAAVILAEALPDNTLAKCYLDLHARHERLRELAKAFLHEAHLNTRAEKALREEMEKPL